MYLDLRYADSGQWLGYSELLDDEVLSKLYRILKDALLDNNSDLIIEWGKEYNHILPK